MAEIQNNEDNLQELCKAFISFDSVAEAETFLEDLCTPVDLMAMAARWRVVRELKKGKPYRQIHDETGVSLTTISRVSRCLKYGTNGYNTIYNKIKKEN